MKPLHGENLRIIALILLGWTSFSFADTTTKFLTGLGYSPAFIITFNALICLAAIAVWILYKKGWRGFLSPNWKWLIARAVCIGLVSTGVVNAFARLPLADVYGITFSAPFIAVCLAALLLREEVGWHRWLSVIVGFVGVLILLGPQFETFNIGIVFAAVAALAIAIGTIVIRKIGGNEYLPLFVLYPYIGMLSINLPLSYQELQIPPFPDLFWFGLNTIFVLGGVSLTTYAIANAKTTATLAPFVYVQVIWGVLFGIMLFGNIPTFTTVIGLIIIVSAGLYMIYREKQLNKKPTGINR